MACACRKSNPDILMMQSAQDRSVKNVTDGPNHALRAHTYPTLNACVPHCRDEDVVRLVRPYNRRPNFRPKRKPISVSLIGFQTQDVSNDVGALLRIEYDVWHSAMRRQ